MNKFKHSRSGTAGGRRERLVAVSVTGRGVKGRGREWYCEKGRSSMFCRRKEKEHNQEIR